MVLVATVRALKYNGGVPKAETGKENLEALEKGLPNLLRHVENITTVYKLPCVVAINRFPQDTEAELALVEKKCKELGVNVALSEVWGKGGEGGIALAEEVVRLCEQPNDFTFSYALADYIEQQVEGGVFAQMISGAIGPSLFLRMLLPFLLCFIGANMVREALSGEEEEECCCGGYRGVQGL